MPSDERSGQPAQQPRSEAQQSLGTTPNEYNFFWASTPSGQKLTVLSSVIVGVLLCIKGWIDVNPEPTWVYGGLLAAACTMLFLYVGLGVACWLLLLNICRFVHHVNVGDVVRGMWDAHRERAELASLRRKAEIRRLRREFDADTEGNKE
jgi:hypothetical protein